MTVPDHAVAGHYLRHISYYRLRAYWLPFEDAAAAAGDHKFKTGSCFDDVLSLYVFDRRLRLLVMDAVERIEVSLRGNWAHHLAMRYGPHGYLDPALYDRADRYAQAFASLIEEIERSKDTFILHYKKKYDDPEHPPIWMTAEVISLGHLSKWLGNLNLAMNLAADRRLYNTLAVLGYLMGIVAPGSDWRRQLVELINFCPLADTKAMGFPDNWKNLPAWKPAVPQVA